MKITIKELISILGIDKSKTQTIRNYSDKFNIGIKDPSSGYRIYSPEDVEKLKEILKRKIKNLNTKKIDFDEKNLTISELTKNNNEEKNENSGNKNFEGSKNDLDLMSLRSIIKDEIEGFVNLSRTAIITAQEVGKLRAVNEFQTKEIQELKEKFDEQKSKFELLEEEKNKLLSNKERELDNQKNKFHFLEEDKKQIVIQRDKDFLEHKKRFEKLEEDKKNIQKAKEEEIKKIETEKNAKILEQRKIIKEQEEKALLLEDEKKALEEKNKLNQEKKNAILKELADLENKWFVGTKRKELLKQLQDLS